MTTSPASSDTRGITSPDDVARRSPAQPCDGVIWFGNVDWWYHNRGHASVRMANRIARMVPTVWINSIGMRMPVPGKTDIAWKRYTRKLKSMFKGLRRDETTGMYVYSPWFIPRYSPKMLELNGWLLAQQVRLIQWRLRMKKPAACLSMPTMTPAAERLKWVSVVFDRCDDFTTLPEADRDMIHALEQRLLDLCDHAVYVSEALHQREKDRVDAVMIGHGVDFDAFASARPLDGPRIEAPEALADLPRPIVGFYGGMDDYRMDRDLMIKIARHIQPGTLVLIGPDQMDLSNIKREPNVRHIEQLPPSELPRYAAQFDVGIIPFLRNEFNENCNPTKLKEYLALSYPIVAMKLAPFEPYADLIYQAESHEQFLSFIDQALKDTDASKAAARRQVVAGSSWDVVAGRVAQLLGAAPTSSSNT